MKPFSSLISLVSPESEPVPTPTEQTLLSCAGLLGAVLLAAVWGLGANASAPHALANALKVPMLVVVSGAASLPVTALAWKLLVGHRARPRSLFLAYASAVFTGTLVLALLAPIVALYQHSSVVAGPWIAIVSAVLGFVAGACVFVRVLKKLGSPDGAGQRIAIVMLLVIKLATLAQLASVLPPIFGQRTLFGRGVDGLVTERQR